MCACADEGICCCIFTGSTVCTRLLASPGVYISCLDGVEEEFSHSDTLHVDEVGLEQSLRGLKPLSSHLDHTAIWQLEMCGRNEMKRQDKREYDTTEDMGFNVHGSLRVKFLITSVNNSPELEL